MAEGSTTSRNENDPEKAPDRPRRSAGHAKASRAKSRPSPTSSASPGSTRSTPRSSSQRSSSRPATKQSSDRRIPRASRRPDQPEPARVRGARTPARPHPIGHQAHPTANSIRQAGRRAVKPALAGATATAAIASATALIRTLQPKPRRVLGIPVRRAKLQAPNSKQTGLTIKALTKNTSRLTDLDLDTAARTIAHTGRQLARAGKQAGKLAGDIERAGQTTERVGKLLAR
jgi:hypothetical protein